VLPSDSSGDFPGVVIGWGFGLTSDCLHIQPCTSTPSNRLTFFTCSEIFSGLGVHRLFVRLKWLWPSGHEIDILETPVNQKSYESLVSLRASFSALALWLGITEYKWAVVVSQFKIILILFTSITQISSFQRFIHRYIPFIQPSNLRHPIIKSTGLIQKASWDSLDLFLLQSSRYVFRGIFHCWLLFG
jgi:hypothetical protein